jgi:GntR family transcriptional regulator/MocR family aminotransferase
LTYRQRRDALVAAVDELMAGASITGLDAGHHALLQLPAGADEVGVVTRAAAEGVLVRGLGEYRVTPDDASPGGVMRPALVIGFGNVTTSQIRHGISVLGALVAA